jgi:hypothetical protein
VRVVLHVALNEEPENHRNRVRARSLHLDEHSIIVHCFIVETRRFRVPETAEVTSIYKIISDVNFCKVAASYESALLPR